MSVDGATTEMRSLGIGFRGDIDEFVTALICGSILRFETLLPQKLREHGAGNFIAESARRHKGRDT